MQDTFKITLTKLRTAFLPHRRSLPLHFFRLSYSIQGLPIWNIPLTLAIGSGDQSLHKILCVSQKPIVFLKQVNLLNSLSHESIQNTRKNKLIWMKSYLMPYLILCLTVNNRVEILHSLCKAACRLFSVYIQIIEGNSSLTGQVYHRYPQSLYPR